jgi:butyryl-CoA:acetate CoA-transferase
MMQVTPMDSHGWFNFGPNGTHLKAACERSKCIILEVNTSMPYCHGGFENRIHIDDVSMIVEGDNKPLDEMGGSGEPSETDLAVARLVMEEIPDGACLQLGIGSMPSAVGKMIAESDLKDLGVHSEMYVDAFVEMSKAGKITGAHKPFDKGRQTYAFAAGTKQLYDFLDNNPECMTAPVSYVNDITRVSQIPNFISINGAVDIDLYGQVSSESSGINHISGAGGQMDFVMGAYLAKGGKSFICCSSSFKDKKTGELKSRIRPTLLEGSVVTATRTNLHYLVTEYGKVNVKGMSTWQRAESIINIAHPQFREGLIAEAEKMHIWRQSNKK